MRKRNSMLSVCDTVQLTDRAGEQHYVLHLIYLSDLGQVVATLSTGGFKSLSLGCDSMLHVSWNTKFPLNDKFPSETYKANFVQFYPIKF